MAGRVIVVGSVNVDLVITGTRLPRPGETVSGGSFAQHDGGKGANQAVAAARLGARTQFVGAVGDDGLGAAAREALSSEGIDLTGLAAVRQLRTGVALILVAPDGENLISVAPGANDALTPDIVERALARVDPADEDVVLVSNEIPGSCVAAALAAGRRGGARTLFNPAPADGVDASILALTDVLTPNRSEAAILRALVSDDPTRDAGDGDETAGNVRDDALGLLAGARGTGGVREAVVVTLGRAGALIVGAVGPGAATPLLVPAPAVAAVDATGAGDAFAGCLAASLAAGLSLSASVERAVVAGALSTTKAGARAGMPTAPELEAALKRTRS
jgi:ribokinase